MTAVASLAGSPPKASRLPPQKSTSPFSVVPPYQPAPLPANEAERLNALRSQGILDTLPEREFDDIVQLASDICGTPIALVSLVDEDRQWFKAALGIEVRETPRSAAFCAHTILGTALLIVEDAKADARFAGSETS